MIFKLRKIHNAYLLRKVTVLLIWCLMLYTFIFLKVRKKVSERDRGLENWRSNVSITQRPPTSWATAPLRFHFTPWEYKITSFQCFDQAAKTTYCACKTKCLDHMGAFSFIIQPLAQGESRGNETPPPTTKVDAEIYLMYSIWLTLIWCLIQNPGLLQQWPIAPGLKLVPPG